MPRPTPTRALRTREELAASSTPNLLLAALDESDKCALGPHIERLGLKREEAIFDEGGRIGHLYFPCNAVFSLVQKADGRTVEIGTVGREGFVGIPAIMFTKVMNAYTFVQVDGAVDRIPLAVVLARMESSVPLRRLLMRYASTFHDEVARSVVCNRVHSIEERCARWILMTRDRTDTDTLPLKQQFLSFMLGVHRPAVTLAAGALQKAGLISYSRGIITVDDREGLEEAACSCYAAGRDKYEALLGMSNDPAA